MLGGGIGKFPCKINIQANYIPPFLTFMTKTHHAHCSKPSMVKWKIKIEFTAQYSRQTLNQIETSTFNRNIAPIDWNKIIQWRS